MTRKNKIKPIKHKVGVKTLSQAAHRLVILDKVLFVFGMCIGACQEADIDIQGDVITSIRLTVYFIK